MLRALSTALFAAATAFAADAGAPATLEVSNAKATQLAALLSLKKAPLVLVAGEARVSGSASGADRAELTSWLEAKAPALRGAALGVEVKGANGKAIAFSAGELRGEEALTFIGEVLKLNTWSEGPLPRFSFALAGTPADALAATLAAASKLELRREGSWLELVKPGAPPLRLGTHGTRANLVAAGATAGEAAQFVAHVTALKSEVPCDAAPLERLEVRNVIGEDLLKLLSHLAGPAAAGATCAATDWKGTAEELSKATLLGVVSGNTDPHALVRTAGGALFVVSRHDLPAEKLAITHDMLRSTGSETIRLELPERAWGCPSLEGARLTAVLTEAGRRSALVECAAGAVIVDGAPDAFGEGSKVEVQDQKVIIRLPGATPRTVELSLGAR